MNIKTFREDAEEDGEISDEYGTVLGGPRSRCPWRLGHEIKIYPQKYPYNYHLVGVR